MGGYLNYFAYGSNMLTGRLTVADRCPSAKVIGTAFVEGYSLDFSKRSRLDSSGKATIVAAHDRCQYGVVFTIKESDRNKLNEAEGLGKGYDLIPELSVTMTDSGLSKSTFTYCAPEEHRDSGQIPFDWYLAYVVAGALQHQLPEAVISAYKNTHFKADGNAKRKAENLEILKKAGFQSIEQVLG